MVRTVLDRLSRARGWVSQVLSIPTHAHTPYRAVLGAERVGVLLDEDLEDAGRTWCCGIESYKAGGLSYMLTPYAHSRALALWVRYPEAYWFGPTCRPCAQTELGARFLFKLDRLFLENL